MNVLLLILSTIIYLVAARPEDFGYRFDGDSENPTCGYDSCHPTSEDVLNVHIVPHTHDDVGWLKTVDQYYFGSRSNIQKAGVQYIIDSVIDELLKDPVRRFVYVETSFFSRWWSEQTDHRRHLVKRLVSEGRLEFAGGAWSMNDEAATHYHSVLDQLTWGLRVLNDTFGRCGRPIAGWQIDPFGHSRELANMWALSGFDGLLMGRVDYQDRSRRVKDKDLEMLWRGSDDLGKQSDLLTGIMYNTYQPPPGFCFDIVCADEPFIDDIKSPEYNVDRLVKKFVDYIDRQSKAQKTNNLIVTMGDDFSYQDAQVWYKNLDKLIKYVNEREPRMKLIYSTPGCYIKSLHDSKKTWSQKVDDFFPYASDPHAYWTGYFTSRPTSKYFERRGNNLLQVCKQLYAMTNLDNRNKVDLDMLRSAMGIFQHHDAITGTEKQHVADDYARILEEGIVDCLNVTYIALNELMSNNKNKQELTMSMCKLNETVCEITESSKKFIITVYNPLGHELNHYIKLPVTGREYIIKDGSGMVLKSEIVPVDVDSLKRQSYDNNIDATAELLFQALSLPALGYKSYYVTEIDNNIKEENRPVHKVVRSLDRTSNNNHRLTISFPKDADISDDVEIKSEANDADLSITNGFLTVHLDSTTGLIDSVTIAKNGTQTQIPFSQEMMYYKGMKGFNANFDDRASGAYIFRPNGSEPIKLTDKPINTIFKGQKVQEIHQSFSNWATQVIRLYKNEQHIEFEWLVGPIPVDDTIGKEVIMRYTTDFKNNGVFYTDSNGRQMLKRTRNKRPTWNLEIVEPVAGNYYPITSMISIKDDKSDREMFILNDRAQGGGSINDGQAEIMVHRRLLYDDAFGVGEPLNETISGIGLVAKGTHFVVFGDAEKTGAGISRILALKNLLQPAIFLSSADNLPYDQWIKNRNEFSGVNSMPANVHILTLEPWKDRSILLRLENFFQTNDYNGSTATVDLNQLFTGMKINSVRETLLAANQWKDEAKRFEWKSNEEEEVEPINVEETNKFANKYEITLAPMEIRTFVIHADFI